MWNQTFVLADKIKGTLLVWTAALIAAATVTDQFYVHFAMQVPLVFAMQVPLVILGVIAQAAIVVTALRIGLDTDAQTLIRPNFGLVLGICLVSGLAILLGSLLLIIPGIFLLVRWWVAVPVALDRNLGLTEALHESWELTKPHWASILGIFLILLAVIMLFFVPGVLTGLSNVSEDEVTSIPMLLLENTVIYCVGFLGTVSTVAIYRTIYQPVAQLRQVFE